MESLDLVGVGRLHVSCSSVSPLAESSSASLASPAAHGFILVWEVWVLVFYIGGVTKLDRLVASPLGSILDYLHWALSLFLKRRLSCPLVMGWGRYIDGGWNTRFWLVRRSVRALRCIVCCLRGGLVVSYFRLI